MMSTGFTGSTTRSLDEVNRAIESHMDTFTDEFSPPSQATRELPVGASPKKRDAPYEQSHDDYVPEAKSDFGRMQAAGKAEDQEAMDVLDQEVHRYESRVKDPADQFPMSGFHSMVDKRMAGVDEARWQKAKDAYEQATRKGEKIDDKWAFINWWYEHGGK